MDKANFRQSILPALVAIFGWGTLVLPSHASIPRNSSIYRQSQGTKKNNYIADGVFTGGKAGLGATILSIRHAFSPRAQLERVIVDLGDRDAKPAGLTPGYFQASLDSANKRLVLDVSQLRMSKVSETQLQQLFKKSPYVASVEFTMDPEDKGATLVLNLKQPVRLEVFQMLKDSSPARIVMDLKPTKLDGRF